MKPLTDKDRAEINKHLRSLEDLMGDVEKAKTAGIEGADAVGARCTHCRDNLVKIKQTYFPNKP